MQRHMGALKAENASVKTGERQVRALHKSGTEFGITLSLAKLKQVSIGQVLVVLASHQVFISLLALLSACIRSVGFSRTFAINRSRLLCRMKCLALRTWLSSRQAHTNT
jgi:hypothetical protein